MTKPNLLREQACAQRQISVARPKTTQIRPRLQPGRVQGSFPEGGTSLHPLQPIPRADSPRALFHQAPSISSFEINKGNPTKIFLKRHLMKNIFLFCEAWAARPSGFAEDGPPAL